jgi:serine/threonine-protein kinase/endoribonuclease IRE1
MGCVYYYVLSNGYHLFGDPIKRQANILSNEYDMSRLVENKRKKYERILAVELITDMIAFDSMKRPTAEAILKHPFYWRDEKTLGFMQDVSERIEKLNPYMDPLRFLERNAQFIVRDDWSLHLDESITDDLRSRRDYHGISVKDLLRALRNKVSLANVSETCSCITQFLLLEKSLSRVVARSEANVGIDAV